MSEKKKSTSCSIDVELKEWIDKNGKPTLNFSNKLRDLLGLEILKDRRKIYPFDEMKVEFPYKFKFSETGWNILKFSGQVRSWNSKNKPYKIIYTGQQMDGYFILKKINTDVKKLL